MAMPGLNFKPEFAPLILSGEKTQTIRKVRKNPIREGDNLYLYVGMRGPSCKKLKEVVCQRVRQIVIEEGAIYINGISVISPDLFAERDGFRSSIFRGAEEQFFDFFRKQYGLPFYGVLIQW